MSIRIKVKKSTKCIDCQKYDKLPLEKYYQRTKEDGVYIEPECKIRKVYDYNGHSVALLSEESYKEFEYGNKI